MQKTEERWGNIDQTLLLSFWRSLGFFLVDILQCVQTNAASLRIYCNRHLRGMYANLDRKKKQNLMQNVELYGLRVFSNWSKR